ncbi:MAG: hypothetical protein ACYC2X_06540 [Coriobacteriia bacterium]
MYHDAGNHEERAAERAGPAQTAAVSGVWEPVDPVDTLLEAHATIVSEIRARAAQPDLDGREIAALAEALKALEVAIDVVGDGTVASLTTYGQHAGS